MSSEKKPSMSWASIMEEEDELRARQQQTQRIVQDVPRRQQESRAQQIAREHRAIEDAEKRKLMEDDRRKRELERVQRLSSTGIATPERTRKDYPALSPWKVPVKEPQESKHLEDQLKQLQVNVNEMHDKVRKDVSFVVRRLEEEEKLRDEKLQAYSKKEDLDRRILQDKINKQQEELSALKNLLDKLADEKQQMKNEHEKEMTELRQELTKQLHEEAQSLKEDFQKSINQFKDEISQHSEWKVVPPRRFMKPTEEAKRPEERTHENFEFRKKVSRQWRRTESPKKPEDSKSPTNPPKTH